MEEITVEQGRLRGKHVYSEESGRCYFSFQGIPYAAPPVSELRFRAPRPPHSWTGVRDATTEGNICPQLARFTHDYQGDEDCLFLNVYTPQLPTRNQPLLPVMFRIHGGGFTVGNGNTEMYGPDFLVAEDIVVVTINYRLGVLGFLCLEEDGVGNAGLKDQVAALRWVRRNIALFGGDPDRITIAGESAGGASVEYLLLSPMARGLFQCAIAESGSSLLPWAFTSSPRKKAFQLGEVMGCKTKDARELMAFFRSKPCQELIEACPKTLTTIAERVLRPFAFVPCVEKAGSSEEAFLTEHPLTLLQKGSFTKVPLLTGVNSHEGIFMLTPIKHRLERALVSANRNIGELMPEDLKTGDPTADKKLTQQVCQYYFKGQPISEINLDRYMEFLGDLMFIIKFSMAVKLHLAKSTAPVYLFQFGYDGKYTFLKNALRPDIQGASHADELFYLFATLLLSGETDLPASAPERLVRKRMVKMWTNFVKTGKPIGEPCQLLPVRWPPASRNKMAFLNIGRELTVQTDIAKDRILFWEKLYKQQRKLPKNKL